ncbi:phage terminase small subunit [Paenibacillus alvei]|uniref:Putative phage-related terminase small subunit skin element n=1 Tax=Paenibacillus alvei TaxID=44250 RepID=A0A383RHY1_PAEAL|nr:phage terminase small subunit [Paenibacillus alvei]SYX85906.1 putative phage-related terminase small subunit; skin element [Paenibacillus alvei]
MVEKHISAEQDYMQGLKYKEIADKYNVTLNTVKSWKQRHGWQRNKGAPDAKGVHTNRRGAPNGNKNALGNEGGAPKGNQNAVTHGFFSKYLPEETLEIMGEIAERSPLDMLWDQITIQYTAIVRAQRIMFVESKGEMIKELKKAKYEYIERDKEEDDSGGGYDRVATEEEYEFQFAWDRHATFLTAQSRAMSELRSSIRQYEDMCRQGYADEEQQLRISKLKAEVKALGEGNSNDKPVIIDDIGGEDDGN